MLVQRRKAIEDWARFAVLDPDFDADDYEFSGFASTGWIEPSAEISGDGIAILNERQRKSTRTVRTRREATAAQEAEGLRQEAGARREEKRKAHAKVLAAQKAARDTALRKERDAAWAAAWATERAAEDAAWEAGREEREKREEQRREEYRHHLAELEKSFGELTAGRLYALGRYGLL